MDWDVIPLEGAQNANVSHASCEAAAQCQTNARLFPPGDRRRIRWTADISERSTGRPKPAAERCIALSGWDDGKRTFRNLHRKDLPGHLKYKWTKLKLSNRTL